MSLRKQEVGSSKKLY